MNKGYSVQREEWLTEAISGLEQVVHSGQLSGNDDAFKRMLREYQDELTVLKEKDDEQCPLIPPVVRTLHHP